MQSVLRRTGFIFASIATVLLAGCAGSSATESVQTPEEKVFYPASPAAPRLQFLVSMADAKSWAASSKDSSFANWVTGADPKAQNTGHLQSPYGAAARDGKLYVCDVGLNCVHVIDVARKRYHRLEPASNFSNPVNITIADDGTRYIADTGKRQVVVYDANDNFVRAIGDPKTVSPIDVVVKGDKLYVVDVVGGQVEIWNLDGQVLKTISQKGNGPEDLFNPTNAEIGPDGLIYVTDTFDQVVKIFDEEGKYRGAIGGAGSTFGHFARPKGIAIDSAGTVYVADTQWNVIQAFDSKGQLLLVFGEAGAEPQNLAMPAGITIDRTSISAFRKYLAPNFEPQYLLFVVNQYGKNKVCVFAYGRDTSRPASDYNVAPAAAADNAATE